MSKHSQGVQQDFGHHDRCDFLPVSREVCHFRMLRDVQTERPLPCRLYRAEHCRSAGDRSGFLYVASKCQGQVRPGVGEDQEAHTTENETPRFVQPGLCSSERYGRLH